MRHLAGALLLLATVLSGPATANASPAVSCPFVEVAQIQETHLVAIRIALPDGHGWLAIGHMHFKLLCGIESGVTFDLRLQRHNRIRPNEFEWATVGNKVEHKLAGKNAGYTWTMKVEYACRGIANWRMRLFSSPGVAADEIPVALSRKYFPSEGGKRLECNT